MAEIRQYNAAIPTFDDFRRPGVDAGNAAADPGGAKAGAGPKFRLLSNGRLLDSASKDAAKELSPEQDLVCRIMTSDRQVMEFKKSTISGETRIGWQGRTGSGDAGKSAASDAASARYELVFDNNYDAVGYYDYSDFNPEATARLGPFFS